MRGAQSSASLNLSLEPSLLPVSTPKNELDVNYENMIENLLLQQVLLYTRERSNGPQRLRSSGIVSNSLLVRQQVNTQTDPHHSVLTSSIYDNTNDEEPTLCLIESHQKNSSDLIEDILVQYNQRNDKHSLFDRNLMDLIVERNRERRNVSFCTNNSFYSRLQWLAIGLVIDRFFFYVYFTATVVSYFVTLWLIPFSHPNLTIDIEKL
ncbi:unnamed protein product [Adineta steineri]|uniref:Neurotransmitter-gated ion-channel transmembrane domain-containing protein n=1 Tax=Adineta steineri TaxID=433720 RepID=A0A814M5A0_9BILA|nr:unnamed protein product [Adineta steineri]CAF1107255.1 unnamed protein product [Adineta steineri]CAF3660679.1 unnamed protein product [Adineta steineri]